MLTRWIVDLYAWIIEVALWLFLIAAAVAGYMWTVPLLDSSGWRIESEGSWSFAGAIVSTGIAFLISAVVIGPVVVLVDIRRSVRSLEEGGAGRAPSKRDALLEARNPFLAHDADPGG